MSSGSLFPFVWLAKCDFRDGRPSARRPPSFGDVALCANPRVPSPTTRGISTSCLRWRAKLRTLLAEMARKSRNIGARGESACARLSNGLKITKHRRRRRKTRFVVIRHLGKLCESRHHRSFWDANCRSFVFFKPFQAIEAPIFFCIPIFRHFQAIMPASRGEGGVWATRGLCVGSRAPARQKMIHLLSAEDISCTALF